ncbi:MAG: ribosomal protein S18 acetylase RimI-like enzyme [Patiriisocius sp.]|jgi:ribosomal protein S18 acetylase RimI-like enzyme
MEDVIRAFHFSDLYMLYRICLLTGADGEDASGTIDNEILGHYFAAPYAVLEPERCHVLTVNGATAGYILGTGHSTDFALRCESSWWPQLRDKYSVPLDEDQSREAILIRAIHRGYEAPACAKEYPAHLHIDLLPEAQGRGNGSRLITKFIKNLKQLKIPGLHLGVSKGNSRALAWYPKFGFEVVEETDSEVTFGLRL